MKLLMYSFLGLLFIIPIQEKKELSEVSRLKAENLKLSALATQCQISLLDNQNKSAAQEISKRQADLELQFKLELNCKNKFDWQTLGCAADDPKTIK